MIEQITVFLENSKGRLAALCRTIGNAGINMHALTVADTSDYGVVRIICDNPAGAKQILGDAGYSVNITRVSAVKVPNRPGGLADLLEVLDQADVNIEYGYCFSMGADEVVDILKIHGSQRAMVALSEAGFEVLQPQDVYKS